MITVVDPDAARKALLAGRLKCPEPGCVGALRVGGVDSESVAAVSGHLIPCPGGVGPVMLGVLMRNVARATLRSDREAAQLASRSTISA